MELIDCWIMAPNLETLPQIFLFSIFNQGKNSLKSTIQIMLTLRCVILTLGQRCKDWFPLRLFRLTATLFAAGLLSSNHFRRILCLKEKEELILDDN